MMQHYVKTYLDYFGYYEGVYMSCELPTCYKQLDDVHHIDARGMGGNPSGDKDNIDNLMGLCRAHHEQYGDRTESKGFLRQAHRQFMIDFGRGKSSLDETAV